MRRRIRLRMVIAVLVVLIGAGWAVAATRGLKQGLVYYYTPSEVVGRRPASEVIRVGGQVLPGSVRWNASARVLHFKLGDGRATLAVVNTGAPPSLFRAGAGAVVEGHLVGGILRSDQVIVKHDQNYRPPGPKRTSG